MKKLSSALSAQLSAEVTSFATCWKLTRRDGVVLGFCDHDRAIDYEGVTYLAQSGFSPSAVESSAALNVDNMELDGLLDHAAIGEEALLTGLYDYSEIEVFLVDYENLSAGRMHLRTGWLGEVTLKNQRFTAEVRGLTQHLSPQLGTLYTPTCRAQLGDAACQVALSAYRVTGNITAITSRTVLLDDNRAEEAGYFAYGSIRFTSGQNAGISMEIKEYSNGQFVVAMPLPYAAAIGDGYEVLAGCDKTLGTCVNRFQNAINFRGEPHVPGTDRLYETAGTVATGNNRG